MVQRPQGQPVLTWTMDRSGVVERISMCDVCGGGRGEGVIDTAIGSNGSKVVINEHVVGIGGLCGKWMCIRKKAGCGSVGWGAVWDRRGGRIDEVLEDRLLSVGSQVLLLTKSVV